VRAPLAMGSASAWRSTTTPRPLSFRVLGDGVCWSCPSPKRRRAKHELSLDRAGSSKAAGVVAPIAGRCSISKLSIGQGACHHPGDDPPAKKLLITTVAPSFPNRPSSRRNLAEKPKTQSPK